MKPDTHTFGCRSATDIMVRLTNQLSVTFWFLARNGLIPPYFFLIINEWTIPVYKWMSHACFFLMSFSILILSECVIKNVIYIIYFMNKCVFSPNIIADSVFSSFSTHLTNIAIKGIGTMPYSCRMVLYDAQNDSTVHAFEQFEALYQPWQ